MRSIKIVDEISGKSREVVQLKTIEDVNEHIDSQIEISDMKEIMNQRQNNDNNKKDGVDHLQSLYKYINREAGYFEKAFMNREDILEMKRENMIDCINKYGEIWLNPNGSYCTPIENHSVLDES